MNVNFWLVCLAFIFVGCAASSPTTARLPIEFKVCGFTASPGLAPKSIPGRSEQVYLHNQASLTNRHISSAKVKPSPEGTHIEIVFTPEGGKLFAEVTQENIGKPLAIVVDGEVLSAPVVQESITGGRAIISGNFSEEEAKKIAEGIMGN